jgi:hypothetical protein
LQTFIATDWLNPTAFKSGVGHGKWVSLFFLEISMYRLTSCSIFLCAAVFGGAAPSYAQYLPPTANLLLRYDTDQDGIVSKVEMDSGVGADYALADTDENDCISGQEIRDENDRRLNRDGGVASPIADWNLDGCVNMNEFGSSIRSYFSFADRSRDGQVSTAELNGPSMPITLPTPPSEQRQAQPTAIGTGTLQTDPNGQYDPYQYGGY